MKELILYIEEITPFTVDKDKMFAFIYSHKIKASRLYFKLITASRLDRENWLDQFIEFSIYMENE